MADPLVHIGLFGLAVVVELTKTEQGTANQQHVSFILRRRDDRRLRVHDVVDVDYVDEVLRHGGDDSEAETTARRRRQRGGDDSEAETTARRRETVAEGESGR